MQGEEEKKEREGVLTHYLLNKMGRFEPFN